MEERREEGCGGKGSGRGRIDGDRGRRFGYFVRRREELNDTHLCMFVAECRDLEDVSCSQTRRESGGGERTRWREYEAKDTFQGLDGKSDLVQRRRGKIRRRRRERPLRLAAVDPSPLFLLFLRSMLLRKS